MFYVYIKTAHKNGQNVIFRKAQKWRICRLEIGQSSHCGQVRYKNIFSFHSSLFRLHTSVCRRFSRVSQFSKIGSTKWFTRLLQFRLSRSLPWLQTAQQLCKKLIFSYLSLRCIFLQSTENLKSMSTKNNFLLKFEQRLLYKNKFNCKSHPFLS